MTIVAENPPKLSKRLPGRKYDRPFFFGMTALLAVVVAIGFAPTYYLAGGFLAPLPSRIVHIHAAVQRFSDLYGADDSLHRTKRALACVCSLGAELGHMTDG